MSVQNSGLLETAAGIAPLETAADALLGEQQTLDGNIEALYEEVAGFATVYSKSYKNYNFTNIAADPANTIEPFTNIPSGTYLLLFNLVMYNNTASDYLNSILVSFAVNDVVIAPSPLFSFIRGANPQAGAIDGSIALNLDDDLNSVKMTLLIIDSDAGNDRTWITSTPYVGMTGYNGFTLGVQAARPMYLINLGTAS
jgi:hypothetical protein